MADKTPIEWCDSTWNPVVGCSVISPGCTNCYAMKLAGRLAAMGSPIYKDHTTKTKAGFVWNGKVAASNWGQVIKPLSWREPRRIFVNSMSDLFHDDMPFETIVEAFGVMAVAKQPFHGPGDGHRKGPKWTDSGGKSHTSLWPNAKHGPHIFQILTKRSANMREKMNSPRFRKEVAGAAYRHAHNRTTAGALADEIADGRAWPLPNVWLGVSVEDQQRAEERIPDLLATPAAIRFLSCEPLLGPVDLTEIKQTVSPGFFGDCLQWYHRGKSHEDEGIQYPKIDWVIAGGESGPSARPIHPQWPRDLKDQCITARVPFFFKQWGEWTPGENVDRTKGYVRVATWFDGDWHFGRENLANEDGHRDDEPDLYRLGKKAAGRLLDGRTWDQFPASLRTAPT